MLKNIKQILEEDATPWTGSTQTEELVREQIAKHWGEEEAEDFDPAHDTRTFRGWLERNFAVKKGEKGLRSFVVLEEKDLKGKVVKRHVRNIWLFHKRQVSPIPCLEK